MYKQKNVCITIFPFFSLYINVPELFILTNKK